MKKRIAFGMDGWSGVMGEDFTQENVILVAEAFAVYLTSNEAAPMSVAVGFDGRKESGVYAELVSRILAAKGIKVILSSSVVPTPILSFAARQYGCAAGIMVTGGHKHPKYNGLKFRGAHGGLLGAKEIDSIASLIKASEIRHPEPGRSKLISVVDFLPAYLANLKAIVDFSLLRSFAENPKNVASVLIDSMGGAGQNILEDIFVDRQWRAQTLFGEPEPNFFYRLPQILPENLDPLKYNVSVTDTAFGIATDGDGGRCGIVYDNGDWVESADVALALLWHLLEQKKWRGSVVAATGLIEAFGTLAKRWNVSIIESPADFSSIAAMMANEEAIFAADEKGGFAYGKCSRDTDGILTGLLFAEMIAMSGKSIREIVKDVCKMLNNDE